MSEGSVPYYLMPLAALLGIFAVFSTFKATHQVYCTIIAFKKENSTSTIPPPTLLSKSFFMLIFSIVLSTVAYGFICAQVNNSIVKNENFDPYEILSIGSGSNSTVIKSAYRNLSKIHHPDKGGDANIFYMINLAYRALSDIVGRENYEKYGHPDGPQTQTLSFAIPEWLLKPERSVAIVLLIMYFGLFIAIVYYLLTFVKNKEKQAENFRLDNSVAQSDIAYLATKLRPGSSHLDVLYYIATAPESIEFTEKAIEKAEEIKRARIELLNPTASKGENGTDIFDMDDGGWAEDEDEDEDIKAAKAKQEEKEKLAKQVAQASGKDQLAKNIKIEGVDDGVLGQEWVERTLSKINQWPPKFGNCSVKDMTFSLKGDNPVPALEHSSVRRNLCMTLGRLNAQHLNTHPELMAAGKSNLIDPTYFKSTMEYRQRTGILLEAALRVAGSARSYRLYKTIVESVSMFKIGTSNSSDEKNLIWFKEIMAKTYGGPEGVPSLKIRSFDIETPGEHEIATEDTCKLEIEMTRMHAECFMKQKIQMAMKQGIPPQVALNTYREGWWILIRCKRIDGKAIVNNDHLSKSPIFAVLDDGSRKNFFEEKQENCLLNAWPFIVSNVAQKSGKVKVSFQAPDVPGKYRFMIDIKSQEFLGCDQVLSIEKKVIDKNLISRKEDEVTSKIEVEGKKEK